MIHWIIERLNFLLSSPQIQETSLLFRSFSVHRSLIWIVSKCSWIDTTIAFDTRRGDALRLKILLLKKNYTTKTKPQIIINVYSMYKRGTQEKYYKNFKKIEKQTICNSHTLSMVVHTNCVKKRKLEYK